MKKSFLLSALIAGIAVLGFVSNSAAADTAKERTIKGEAKCAKCSMKEGEKCQTVIQAENKSGKMITYYLADNEVAKDFHSKVCKGPAKATATGTVKKDGDKMILTATKIEVTEAKADAK